MPAVDRRGVVALGDEPVGELVDLLPCPGEHQRGGGVLDVEDPSQRGRLVRPANDIGDLADLGRSLASAALRPDRDPDRVAQVAFRDPGDLGRDRGREERRLAPLGRRGQDRLEVLGEAHVEHLVGLVEDHDLDRVEGNGAALEVVDHPTRRRDDHVDAAAQAPQLLPERLAAVDRQDPGGERFAIAMDRLGDLHRELAGRDEDKGPRAAVAGSHRGDALEHRQGEGRGLARPGGGLGQDVPALEQRRDARPLDRCRLFVAERTKRAEQRRVEGEAAKPVDGVAGAVGQGGCGGHRLDIHMVIVADRGDHRCHPDAKASSTAPRGPSTMRGKCGLASRLR